MCLSPRLTPHKKKITQKNYIGSDWRPIFGPVSCCWQEPVADAKGNNLLKRVIVQAFSLLYAQQPATQGTPAAETSSLCRIALDGFIFPFTLVTFEPIQTLDTNRTQWGWFQRNRTSWGKCLLLFAKLQPDNSTWCPSFLFSEKHK